MNQKPLIVAATAFEVAETLRHFNLSIQDFIEQPDFDILITGVGMTATAFALGKYLHEGYRFVLNVGIAGSFDQSIALGSLVNVKNDIFAELGAENVDSFLTIDELGFGTNLTAATMQIDGLPLVNGITVNKVHGNAQSILKTQQQFGAQIESMEGAAVFFACAKSNMPCAQVRSISNYVTPRNRDAWQIDLAIKNLNKWLIEWILKNTASQTSIL